MNLLRVVFLYLFVMLIMASCQPEFQKFESPEWIEGKLFQQLQSIPGTDTFQICLIRTGYDTLLNGSNFTVFAPDNKAFEDYFEAHAEYSSVYDIPEDELKALVKSHIIQNPWSRDQLKMANEDGWINKRDPENDKPWSYKRQTLYKEGNRKYWIKRESGGNIIIVDSTESSILRTVYQGSRKYVPIFFDHYMDLAEIGSEDFDFYFDRPYEAGYMYLSGAQLSPIDHFAENGFIFILDRVVPPLKNVEQMLESSDLGHDYSMFLELIYLFPSFLTNEYQTNQQPGVEEGQEVPTLYDLKFEDLAFDIHSEFTGDQVFDENTATRYHYGMLAPTNKALQDLIDNVLTVQSGDSTRWPSFDMVPRHIKKIIINSHMSELPVYLSDIQRGFLNNLWDSVFVDPATVIEKQYCSNASFMGLSQAIVPAAFSSVTAPVYLRPQYVGFMKGIELSGLGPVLKRRSATYSFYAVQVGDAYFDNFTQESAINRLLNQVGTSIAREKARKEFIPTLGGNFILYDTTRRPRQLEEPTYNGKTYAANGFNWPKTGHLYWILKYDFPAFFELMEKANMVNNTWGQLNFVNETEFYTVFAPSDEALSLFHAETLTREELQQFIKYHFVEGDIIFTDGNKLPGPYQTLRLDEASSDHQPVFTSLNISPEPDLIRIYDQAGSLICDIPEHWEHSNIMFGRNNPNYQTFGVIHSIDSVLRAFP